MFITRLHFQFVVDMWWVVDDSSRVEKGAYRWFALARWIRR